MKLHPRPNLRRRGEARSHGLFLRESIEGMASRGLDTPEYINIQQKCGKPMVSRGKWCTIIIYIYIYIRVFHICVRLQEGKWCKCHITVNARAVQKLQNWHSPTPVQKGFNGGYNQWTSWLYQLFIGAGNGLIHHHHVEMGIAWGYFMGKCPQQYGKIMSCYGIYWDISSQGGAPVRNS